MKRPRMGTVLRILLKRYVNELAESRPDDKVGRQMVDCGNFLLIEDERGQRCTMKSTG